MTTSVTTTKRRQLLVVRGASDPRFGLLRALVVLFLVGAGCAPVRRAPSPAAGAEARALILEADAEVNRGCYLCLRSATSKYEAAIRAGGAVSSIKAAGAWVLVAARERELGLQPSDALDRARGYRVTASVGPSGDESRASNEVIDVYLEVAAGLPLRAEGVSMEAMGAAVQAARALAGLPPMSSAPRPIGPPNEETIPASIRLLSERARQGADIAAAYLVRSFDCSTRRPASPSGDSASKDSVPGSVDPPLSDLLAFRLATCGNRRDPDGETKTLVQLLIAEPRFHEAHYFLGRIHVAERKLVSAEREFLAAANGLPGMTAAWAMLGITRMNLEEYDWAAADLGRALEIEPRQRQALLAHAQALNYAGRFEEALVPARRLIELGTWFLSDANFWLAFSELQLGRLQEADIHVKEAKRTNPMNGDTARLSGLVAYRLAQMDRAETEFELAISRNEGDCEAHLYLGMTLGQKQRFEPSIVAFVRARNCYAGLVAAAASKAAEIERSALSEARKETARSRLAQRIKAAKRSQAGASLGAAEGEAQRGAFEAALTYLAEAAVEVELTARSNELRTRVEAQRARR